MRRLCLYIWVVFFLCSAGSSVNAQLSCQLNYYDFKTLGAGNQNWDIDTDNDRRVFIANNHGLVVIENSQSELHQLGEFSTIRSVSYINDTLYTGSFEDFGFWLSSEESGLTYTSLAASLPDPDMNNDEIWKIIEHEGVIYFHSFGSIYGYDGTDVFRVDKQGSFMFLHKAGDRVFTQQIQGSLYELRDRTLIEIRGSDFLNDEEVKSVIKWDSTTYLIGTTSGIYEFENNSFTKWDPTDSAFIINNNLNTMIKAGTKLIIGTILNGLYIFDEEFNLLDQINTDNRLSNNTILTLQEDKFGNAWVGLDKGVTYIAFDLPVQSYQQKSLDIGSVYAAALFENELFVGTNQGVYRFKPDKYGVFGDRTLIPGSQGQVWFLKIYDEKLYAGLNEGTFVINDNSLEQVSGVFGGYTLKKAEGKHEGKLIQSTYSDLLVYTKNDDTWRESHTITGFSAPIRFLEFDHLGNLWLGHTVKGLFKVQPNMQFTTIETTRKIGEASGLPRITNRLFKLDNRIMTSYRDSLFQWDTINERFVLYSELDPFFTERGTVKQILPAGDQQYWVIKSNELLLLEVHFNTTRLIHRIIPEMFDFDLVENYEHVVALSDSLHLICLDDGFSILDLSLIDEANYSLPQVDINTVEYLADNTVKPTGRYLPVKSNEISYRTNTISLSWSSSQSAGIQPYFQYKLEGLDSEWSSWITDTSKEFISLPSGEYRFEVRSIGMNGTVTEPAVYSFSIKKPWYLSTASFVLYFFMGSSILVVIRLYRSRKRWLAVSEELEVKHKAMQLEREQAEKEIIKLTNEKLQNEVEHKSAQLASNTMAMMRKNNLLTTIKNELEKQKEELGSRFADHHYRKINKLIDQGIEDEHEWEVFEQLYDQAHGDFFKRLKGSYPQLTPSDLRLCAYLRMNLSSKEIAPLLNISVRGVEERRYRLRKRLNLDTNVNLNELIMTF
ncbi:MAG: triple tyrosine motif-containing protein [Bacteroidota bacterium]